MNRHTIELAGPVHIADHGGTGPPIVLIHGLGGSHVNWTSIARSLTERGRVVAPDLVAFGYTPPEDRRSDLGTNRRLVVDLIDHLGAGPAVLVGNSMGGLLAMLVAEAAPDRVRGVVLLDPALPMVRPRWDSELVRSLVVPTLPWIGPRYLRRTLEQADPETYVDERLEFLMVDPSRLDPEAHAASLAMTRDRLEMPWAADAFAQAARSIAATLTNRRRLARRIQDLSCPGLVIHGAEDQLVDVSSAHWLVEQQPAWQLEILDGIGHVPQLEAAETTLALIEDWLTGLDTAAA